MDTERFVQNVKNICKLRGVLPTIACRESGAGKSLLSSVSSGSIPSVEKVQLLAQYLGCTTSDLLGEKKGDILIEGIPNELTQAEFEIVLAYRKADARTQSMVDLALEPFKVPSSTEKAM